MPSIYSQTSGRGDSMDRGRTRSLDEHRVSSVPRSPSFARTRRAAYTEQIREGRSRSRFERGAWHQTDTPWDEAAFQQPPDNGYWYGQNTQLPHQYYENPPSQFQGRASSQATSQFDCGYGSRTPDQAPHNYYPKHNNNAYQHPHTQFAGYPQHPFGDPAANFYVPYQSKPGPEGSAQHHRRSRLESHRPRRPGTKSEGQWFMLHFGKKASSAPATRSGDAPASRPDQTQERSRSRARSQPNGPKQDNPTYNFNTFSFTANIFGQTGTRSSPGRATRASSRASTARSVTPQRKQLEASQPLDLNFARRRRNGSPDRTGGMVRV